MNKKLTIILSISGVILAVGVAVFFAWKNAQKIITPPSNDNETNLPNTEQVERPAEEDLGEKIMTMSQAGVVDYWIYTKDGKEDIYYLTKDGSIFKSGGEEDEKIIDQEQTLLNVGFLRSNKDGSLILIETNDSSLKVIKIFNTDKKLISELGKNISSAVFSADSKKIAVIVEENGGQSLKTYNATNLSQKPQKLISLPSGEFYLEWPDNENIWIFQKPSGLSQSPAWKFNLKTNQLSELFTNRLGLSGKFSSISGKGIIFSIALNGKNVEFSIIDNIGEMWGIINLITLPNKCTIDWPKIYCGVPKEIPKKILLPDDYLSKAFYSNDDLYVIDAETNSLFKSLLLGDKLIDFINIKTTSDNIYFLNRKSEKVYKILKIDINNTEDNLDA